MGFKMEFNTINIPDLEISGFLANPHTTPLALVPTTDYEWWQKDNWLGYFPRTTQNMEVAFSKRAPDGRRYLDCIYYVQTKNWANYRTGFPPTGDWIIHPSKFTLSYGDMVNVRAFDDAPAEMYWEDLPPGKPPYLRQQTEYFTYEEKLDYLPVFIEFDPADIPTEVGIFVNGECKGAAVPDSTLIEVNFYREESKADDLVEIAFYYAGKGKKIMSGWAVYNQDRLVYEQTVLRAGSIRHYALVSFKAADGSAAFPIPTRLEQNYPNPFNPETRISFSLEREMPVKLEVFNAKGQKVKTLANGIRTLGRHTVSWNGTDANGKPVGSGVYYYRMETPQKLYTQKMMLLK